MVHILWLSTKYVAHFDSSSWHRLVNRACGDTEWIPHIHLVNTLFTLVLRRFKGGLSKAQAPRVIDEIPGYDPNTNNHFRYSGTPDYFLLFFLLSSLLLSSSTRSRFSPSATSWTSRGHSCLPFSLPVRAFIFIPHTFQQSHRLSAILCSFSPMFSNSRPRQNTPTPQR